jgi:hypothetical protein
MSDKKPFLNHIHYFRAFAIINIVMVHVWHLGAGETNTHKEVGGWINLIRELMFHGSSIYFLFISGFLFSYLSKNPDPAKYYRGKLFNVIIPYIFITLLTSSLRFIIANHTLPFSPELLSHAGAIVIQTLLHGTAETPFWYIPFVTLIFIISPFLLKTTITSSGIVMILISLLPLLGSRTSTHISIGQYLYFFPIYLQGIYVAQHYTEFTNLISKKKNLVGLVAIASSLAIVYVNENPFTCKVFNLIESLFYIQKLSIGILVLMALKTFENRKLGLVNQFAKYSFGIYFLHTIVGRLVPNEAYYRMFSHSAVLVFLASIIRAGAIVFLSLSACLILRKILGRHSRCFIGV